MAAVVDESHEAALSEHSQLQEHQQVAQHQLMLAPHQREGEVHADEVQDAAADAEDDDL